MAFEHKTETEARQQILDMVAEYCDTYHNKRGLFRRVTAFPTLPGSMTIRRW